MQNMEAQRKFYVIENINTSINQIEEVNSALAEQRKLDHEKMVNQYLTSKKLRNHSPNTIRSTEYDLKRFFDVTGKCCWEITMDDVNEYHLSLIETGLANSTRRGYLNRIANFYKFLLDHPEIPQTVIERQAGKLPERIDWKYGVKLHQPVDLWFLPKHVTDDVAVKTAIPTRDNL